MRIFKLLLSVTLVIVLGLGLLLAWVTRNPEQFKPELSRLIKEKSGFDVTFEGELGWQIFPDLRLVVEGLKIDNTQASDDTPIPEITLTRLEVKTALGPLLSANPKLKVDSVYIQSGYIQSGLIQSGDDQHNSPHIGESYKWAFEQLAIENLSENSPFDLSVLFDFASDDISFDGQLVFTLLLDIQAQEHQISNFALRLNENTLSGSATLTTNNIPYLAFSLFADEFTLMEYASETVPVSALSLVPSGPANSATLSEWDETLLPDEYNTLINWSGSIAVKKLLANDSVFKEVRINTEKKDALTTMDISLPDFFSGSALFKLKLNTSIPQYKWNFLPTVQNADTQQLALWLNQKLEWAAPLILNGEISTVGNTQRELAANVIASSSFDGQKGSINIAELRRQALKVTRYTGGAERVADWPKLLTYTQFTGMWNINGHRHQLNIDLDNLSIDVEGLYDPVADYMDMRVDLTIHEHAELNSFNVNATLRELAIPLRCKGKSEEPRCKLDKKGTKRLLSRALSGDSNAAINAKLNKRIEEEVPEKYQDTARALLKSLGGLLKNKSDKGD